MELGKLAEAIFVFERVNTGVPDVNIALVTEAAHAQEDESEKDQRPPSHSITKKLLELCRLPCSCPNPGPCRKRDRRPKYPYQPVD